MADILEKKPQMRTTAELKKLLPFVMNIDFFKMDSAGNEEGMTGDDFQLICENMKFRFLEAG